MEPTAASVMPLLVPLIAAAILIARNARGRRLRIERLWIYPAVIGALALLLVAASPPTSPLVIAALIAVTALGAGIGWYRGRFTHIEINPETHELTSRTSPAGIVLILVLFIVRYGLRSYLEGPDAAALHLGIVQVTDGFILFAVGLLAAQRTEVWLRARKLLAAARPPAP
jgi:hypothetical protein